MARHGRLQRDEAILRHIGRYRLSIRAVLSRLFFDGGRPDDVLKRLQREKQITSSYTEPGSQRKRSLTYGRYAQRYYRLTHAAAKQLYPSNPNSRTRLLGSAALKRHLAVLCFCTLTDRRRRRLELVEARDALGTELPNEQIHVAQSDASGEFVYQLQLELAAAPAALVTERLAQRIEQAQQASPELARYIHQGLYRFAILTSAQAARCQEYRQMIQRWRARQDPLLAGAQCQVFFVPAPDQIREYICHG